MGRHGEQISATQTCHRRGLGAEPPAAGRFFVSFWKKMALLMPFGRTKFLRFESQLNKSLPFTSGQVQNTLKIFHFGVKFCDLAWLRESKYIAFCNIFSIKSFTQRFALEGFCFVMKITSFRNMYDQEPRHPRFNFNNLFNKHFPS